jgi:hypothetical protein
VSSAMSSAPIFFSFLRCTASKQGRSGGSRPRATGHQSIGGDGDRRHRLGTRRSATGGRLAIAGGRRHARNQPGGDHRIPHAAEAREGSRRAAVAAWAGLRSVYDLAQLLALWKPGVYTKDAEEAYFDARFAARERPTYAYPSMAKVLDSTHGQVLYADQLVELVKLLGFDHAWAERFRRAIAGGRAAGRDVMERVIREAGARQHWTTEQTNQLIGLLIRHVDTCTCTDTQSPWRSTSSDRRV